MWYSRIVTKNQNTARRLLINRITQEACRRQAVVKLALRKGKTYASEKYGVSLSSVKRWCKRYDGTLESLKERSHRPHSHPKQHTVQEEELIRQGMAQAYFRYGWEGAYMAAKEQGYSRSYSGFRYAAKRIGLCGGKVKKKPSRKHNRRYPELLTPRELVQIDVKEVPYNCLRGKLKEYGKHLYQWTAIDACTRVRFIYGFEEHTPENTVTFFKMLLKVFPFKIQAVQTDNGTEFTYKYISETEDSPLDKLLKELDIPHKLIPPRTPWHNGKVERSHRNDQRYFYDWEKFTSVDELNRKLSKHLSWSNRKIMRTLGNKSPIELLREKLAKV